MAKVARWRDFTKVSASGLLISRFRLNLPEGDAVLELKTCGPAGAPIRPYDFQLHCSPLGMRYAVIKATKPAEAQKEAVALIKTRIKELQALCDLELEALNNMPAESTVVNDPSLFSPSVISPAANSTNHPPQKEQDESVPVAAPPKRGRPRKNAAVPGAKTAGEAKKAVSPKTKNIPHAQKPQRKKSGDEQAPAPAKRQAIDGKSKSRKKALPT